ncbi:hypothetical protein B0A50_06052 [Salinomyces thailandicus]|uniref:JmjC domain-containing protein n=1 Tax=Salinomyces thailandicus TaxID=706561 RepID=A0A4U0TS45_9PEZI|nr:hypothetical protein B0A50_06052 [Salinomyces thailandica]
MLAGRVIASATRPCRSYTTARKLRPVPILPDASIDTFRKHAFEPAIPALLPRGTFNTIPACEKWFVHAKDHHNPLSLNISYLSNYKSAIVPVEITNNDHFARTEQPLYFFLECVSSQSSTYRSQPSRYFNAYVPGARAIKRTKRSNDFFSASTLTTPTAKVYLAQASLTDLPKGMRDDLPTPELVLKAGKGDVYDSSIWLGQAPTYTPLHRDPNPNLFAQLAGRKLVRLYQPKVGQGIFAAVQERIGGGANAMMRGEEMMQGAEKKALEEEVWGEVENTTVAGPCWEAELKSGDGLFIPKGWWHSIKGVGEGMTGSVNWWFR